MHKLRDLHGFLSDSEQAMLGTELEDAQDESEGYTVKARFRYGEPDEWQEERSATEREGGRGWEDLVGWIEEQGEEDTQGVRRQV